MAGTWAAWEAVGGCDRSGSGDSGDGESGGGRQWCLLTAAEAEVASGRRLVRPTVAVTGNTSRWFGSRVGKSGRWRPGCGGWQRGRGSKKPVAYALSVHCSC